MRAEDETHMGVQVAHGSSVAAQGEFWSARAREWSEGMEPLMLPLYLAALDRARLGRESRLLDLGCGSGGFLRLVEATGVGAHLSGIDAAPALADIARSRVPNANVGVGDVEDLPYGDATFDVVTAFDTLRFAADPTIALREAARVTRLGGRVFVSAWGRPQDCEASGYLHALASLSASSAGVEAFAYAERGALEQFAMCAGLTPIGIAEVDVPWQFRNLDSALRALLSTGPAVSAIRQSSEPLVRAAVMEAISPFRTTHGEYRLENRFRFVVARRIVALYTTYQPRS